MIDLHSHLLPGVDDGSRSVAQSVTVLRRLAADGVTGLALTPHLLASHTPDGAPPAHERAFEALMAAAPDEVRLYRGAEVMLDRPLDAKVGSDRVVTLNRSRYLLVEFPRLVTSHTVEQALQHAVSVGVVPVLAHPERYACCHQQAVRHWRDLGALMQVDGPTLLSPGRRGHRARALVAEGLVDIAAGDNHGDERSLRPAHAAMVGQGGGPTADLLFCTNPAALIEDKLPMEVPPFDFHLPLLSRVRGLFPRSGERT